LFWPKYWARAGAGIAQHSAAPTSAAATGLIARLQVIMMSS
jgi:hypothetical protein